MTDSGDTHPPVRPARIAADHATGPSLGPTHERRGAPPSPPHSAPDGAGASFGTAHDRRATDEEPPWHERYELRGVLGAGGQGIVYRAYDGQLRREVALKTLRSQRVSRESVAAFLGEVRAAASLDHPNIVPIFDAGEFADGRPYYTMRLVEGGSLHAVLKALAAESETERASA